MKQIQGINFQGSIAQASAKSLSSQMKALQFCANEPESGVLVIPEMSLNHPFYCAETKNLHFFILFLVTMLYFALTFKKKLFYYYIFSVHVFHMYLRSKSI